MSDSDLNNAIIGSFLVSLAISLHFLLKGRSTSINGILYGVLIGDMPFIHWRLPLISSIMIGSAIFYNSHEYYFDSPSQIISNLSMIGFGLSGFFVGFGGRLSKGCTTGHLMCNMPRLSLRGFVAVLVFIISGIFIASLRGDESFLDDTEKGWIKDIDYNFWVNLILAINILIVVLAFLYVIVKVKNNQMSLDILVSIIVGIILAVGVCIGGLNKRRMVYGFLNIFDNWNKNLLIFFAIIIGVNILCFYLIYNVKKSPVFGGMSGFTPLDREINWRLITGAFIFGLGWGLGGLCPVSAITLFIFVTPHVSLIWIPFFFIGQISVKLFDKILEKFGVSKGESLLNE